MGFFKKINLGLKKTRDNMTGAINSALHGKNEIDDEFYEDLEEILDKHEPDYVVFAIDYYEKDKIIKFVNMCDDRCIKVYFLPVIYGYFKSARQVELIGSTPLLELTKIENKPWLPLNYKRQNLPFPSCR